MRNHLYLFSIKIYLFLLLFISPSSIQAQNNIQYDALEAHYETLKDSLRSLDAYGILTIGKIEEMDFDSIPDSEKEIMVLLLKNYGFRRLNSIKDLNESKKEIKKAIQKSNQLFPKNHYINIIINENKLLGLPYKQRLEKYNVIIDLCAKNKINPHWFLKEKGKVYHRMLHTEIRKQNEISKIKTQKNPKIMGLFYKAKENYTRAISITKNIESSTRIKNNIAALYEDIGDYKNALSEHKENLKLRKDFYKTNNKHVAASYFNIGSILNNLGEYDEAIKYFQDFVKNYHFNNDNKVDVYIRIADSYLKKGDIPMTSKNYSKAIAVLDTIKMSLETDDAIQDFVELGRDVHAEIMDFAIEHDYHLAFAVSERSRAIGLDKQLGELDAKKNAGIPKDILEKEIFLKQEIQKHEDMLEDASSQSVENIKNIENKISNYKKDLSGLRGQMKGKYPFFYNSEIINIKDIQNNILDNSTSLIEYYVETNKDGRSQRIYIIRIDSESIDTAFIDKNTCQELDSLIDQFHNLISSGNKMSSETSSRNFCDISYSLYQILIETVEKKNPLKEHIYFIPQGKLYHIPFEALVKTPTIDNDIYNPDYLIKSHSSNYGYSMTILHENFKSISPYNKKYLGIAPTRFNASLKKKNLSYTKEEIRSFFQDQTDTTSINRLFYEQANKENFKYYVQKNNYNIIHLATHAEANDTTTKIAFQDAFLNLSELYSMSIKTNMAILSACETGKGKYHTGEGVMSLARGFMYAGSPSTVSSLWSVNDASTKEIISNFYKNLKKGQRKDQALHNAKLNYLNNHPNASPYFWTPLIHIGNNKALELESANYYWIYVIFGIFLLCGLYFLFRKYKS